MKKIIQDNTFIKSKKLETKDFILCAFFAAILVISSVATIPIPFTPVPITLQTLAVFLIGGILGAKRGAISIGIYILLGGIGMPVFSGFQSGFGVLLGATGGYITGFVPAVIAIGYITGKIYGKKMNHTTKFLTTFFAMCIGLVAVYVCGTVQLMQVANLDVFAAIYSAVFPFLPMDLGKAFFAAAFTLEIQKRVPALLEW